MAVADESEDECVQSLAEGYKDVAFWVALALTAFLTLVLSIRLPG